MALPEPVASVDPVQALFPQQQCGLFFCEGKQFNNSADFFCGSQRVNQFVLFHLLIRFNFFGWMCIYYELPIQVESLQLLTLQESALKAMDWNQNKFYKIFVQLLQEELLHAGESMQHSLGIAFERLKAW